MRSLLHNIRQQRPKLFHSVFTKLLLIFLLSGLSIYLLIGFFARHLPNDYQHPFQAHVFQYAHYLQQELGNPPLLENAERLATDLAVQIRYEAGVQSWQTHDTTPSLHELKRIHWKSAALGHGRYRRQHVFILKYPEGHVLLSLGKWRWKLVDRPIWFLSLLGLLSILIFLTYLWVRHTLRPLKSLRQGVHEVQQGNFDVRLPSQGTGELQDLVHAFNQMTQQVQQMMQSKERLLLDVSHELRTPITRIQVALAMMPEGQETQSIREDLEEMETMIAELLESARLQSTHGKLVLESVDVSQLVKEVIADLSTQKPSIRLKKGEGVPMITQGDPVRLKQVLLNILQNAQKYSTTSDAAIDLSLSSEQDFWKIQIQDHGEGINESELPFLFEPFYRVDKSRTKQTGGYGLGLYLCKVIMEAHGGEIQIQSQRHQGTAVTLRLPHKIASHA